MKLPATTTYSMNDIINEEDEVISIYIDPSLYEEDDTVSAPGLYKAQQVSSEPYVRIPKRREHLVG